MPRPKSPRGATIATALRAVSLLREQPRRPGELADELGVSLATTKRILGAIRDAGQPITVERRGREAWYSLPA